jgi:hypothetical protein
VNYFEALLRRVGENLSQDNQYGDETWNREVSCTKINTNATYSTKVFGITEPVCHLLSPWYRTRIIILPWRWWWHVPSKRRLTFNGLHGIISLKIELLLTTAVRTSNPALLSGSFPNKIKKVGSYDCSHEVQTVTLCHPDQLKVDSPAK